MPTITPYKFFPAAKPPKKALNSHEVFSVQRLTDVLPKDVEQWIVSSKMDGIRCEATISSAQQAFYTDEGNKIDNKRLSHIVKELAGLRGAPNVFDGELMYSIDGKAQPHNLVAGFMNSGGDTRMDEQDNIFYVVFDLLYSDGKDLSGLPYKQRLELLSSLIKKYPHIKIVKWTESSTAGIPRVIPKVTSDEGVVMRGAGSSYWEFDQLYKFKYTYDLDVVVSEKHKREGGWTYTCKTSDGYVLGDTMKGLAEFEVGDVIRITVDTITRVVKDGKESWSWLTPRALKGDPGELKKLGKTSPEPDSKKRADSLATVKEIWQATQRKRLDLAAMFQEEPGKFVLHQHWWGDEFSERGKNPA